MMRVSGPLLCCALLVALFGVVTHITVDISDQISYGKTDRVHVELVKPELAIAHLAEILKFKTVSSDAADNHVELPGEFQKLHRSLRKQWPNVFKILKVQQVADFSLLLEWRGSDVSLKPILCVSHMDVVAVAPLEERWTQPPFGGVVADGFVWGRGALDLKFSVGGLLEAVSQLLLKGHKPARTVYIAIGHDEEVGGEKGAGAMAELLESRGIRFDHILDEGGSVLADGVAAITHTPVAVVGASEKTSLNYVVEVHGKGGHAMAPPSQKQPSAAIRLARIIQQVEASPPTPRLAPPVTWFLHALGSAAENPVLGYLLRRCHVWPLSSILARGLALIGGELGALTRSTVVTTEAEFLPPGNNVIPSLAKANFNFRLLPSQGSVDWAAGFLERIAGRHSKDGSADVSIHGRSHFAPLSPLNTTGFSVVRRAILETLTGPEGLVVAPYLMLGSTDSRHYAHLSNDIYRFAPFTCNRTGGDLQRIHGVDERVGVDTYLNGIRFYVRYLDLATSK